MTTTPPPRPALRRADDGTVHPAAPHLSSLAVDVAPAARQGRGKGRKKDKDRADDTIEITVTLPKQVRKRLRRKAETYGWTAEEAASHVLRVWADD